MQVSVWMPRVGVGTSYGSFTSFFSWITFVMVFINSYVYNN